MCPSPQPEWIALLSALLTPLLAATAAYIAWQQWRTNRNTLKLDLFERRFTVYDAAIQLINSILGAGKVDQAHLNIFLSKTRSAAFTVGEEIETYLNKELFRRAALLQRLEAEHSSLTDAALVTNNKGQADTKLWLADQYNVLQELFRDQLTLGH